jgi:hypothetical protein
MREGMAEIGNNMRIVTNVPRKVRVNLSYVNEITEHEGQRIESVEHRNT